MLKLLSLKTLYLSNNRLHELPTDFQRLTKQVLLVCLLGLWLVSLSQFVQFVKCSSCCECVSVPLGILAYSRVFPLW